MRRTWFLSLLLLVSCGGGGGGAGAAREVLVILGAGGGSITSSDGRLTLEVPPGALSSDRQIGIRVLDPAKLPADLPDEIRGAEPGRVTVYELLPDGQTFAIPVKVRLATDQPMGSDPATLAAVAEFGIVTSGGETELLPAATVVVDGDADEIRLEGELTHFSFLTEIHGLELRGALKVEVGPVPDEVPEEGFRVRPVGTQVGGPSFEGNIRGRYEDRSVLPLALTQVHSDGAINGDLIWDFGSDDGQNRVAGDFFDPGIPVPAHNEYEYHCSTEGAAGFRARVRAVWQPHFTAWGGTDDPILQLLFVLGGAATPVDPNYPFPEFEFRKTVTCRHEAPPLPGETVVDLPGAEGGATAPPDFPGGEDIPGTDGQRQLLLSARSSLAPSFDALYFLGPDGSRLREVQTGLSGATSVQPLRVTVDGERHDALVFAGPGGGGILPWLPGPGTFGGAQAFSAFDVAPTADETAVLTADRATGQVNYIGWNPDFGAFSGLPIGPSAVSIPAGEQIISAWSEGPGNAVYLLTLAADDTGKLYRYDPGTGQTTFLTATGEGGRQVRGAKTAAGGHFLAVSSETTNEIRLYDVSPDGTFTSATAEGGTGSIQIEVKQVGSRILVASTAFEDDTWTIRAFDDPTDGSAPKEVGSTGPIPLPEGTTEPTKVTIEEVGAPVLGERIVVVSVTAKDQVVLTEASVETGE